jgi:uncharacterized coiled-coil protein SlyX
MRAKEYLEIYKKKIYYFQEVKKAIQGLYPLRCNKRKTEEYFNKYLFADARYRSFIADNDENDKDDEFTEKEGEVDRTIAYKVRIELFNVISRDDTFIYAHNIIGLGANCYGENHRIMACILKEENLNAVNYIKQTCQMYKEDYPKNSLADYLLDEKNNKFYSENRCTILKDEEWWLLAFNMAYEIFDKIRVKLMDPFKAQYMVRNVYFNDKVLEVTIIKIIKELVDNYTYDLTDEQLKKFKMLADNISEHEDERFKKISETYLENINDLNLDEVNWLKSTRLFNYNIIYQWVKHEAFNTKERLKIIDLIEKRFLNEREKHPDIFIYDLVPFFKLLKDEVNVNLVTEKDGVKEYKIKSKLDEIECLKSIAQQKDEEIKKLNDRMAEKEKEIDQLKEEYQNKMNLLENRVKELSTGIFNKGMTMPQQLLAFYYLFNELGISFNNSDKTQWARFINTFTGKNYQNIRAELNIDFESKRTRKNLRVVSDLFAELFPHIQQKVINDSQK